MDPEKNKTATAPSEDEEYSEDEVRQRSRSRRRGPRRNRGRQGQSQALQPVGELGNQVGQVTGQVSDTLSGATGAVSGVAKGLTGGEGGSKKDTLRLRLDLNLDVEVTLKARIHGDLELALLYVQFPSSRLYPSYPRYLMIRRVLKSFIGILQYLTTEVCHTDNKSTFLSVKRHRSIVYSTVLAPRGYLPPNA
ncbi:hypothetical protein AOL_s00173g45 [Orbilia oligospora ATCC 24927]|uniref:Uncharacterized protein n=1 Tax=Arthrobotrys oligospora (strain ATCC 24927 / CBS 115.81 / DSM 1491) TaxID=756982 RepID=G1XNM7_ARTOA|nr:hypothetical protein AOL_s00173g45 [Orbilia oligospora ATCC 24927]EGX44944.1 hypothetical protein AOL_s00173g45 [Orbilia oligospora ATCC 24927]